MNSMNLSKWDDAVKRRGPMVGAAGPMHPDRLVQQQQQEQAQTPMPWRTSGRRSIDADMRGSTSSTVTTTNPTGGPDSEAKDSDSDRTIEAEEAEHPEDDFDHDRHCCATECDEWDASRLRKCVDCGHDTCINHQIGPSRRPLCGHCGGEEMEALVRWEEDVMGKQYFPGETPEERRKRLELDEHDRVLFELHRMIEYTGREKNEHLSECMQCKAWMRFPKPGGEAYCPDYWRIDGALDTLAARVLQKRKTIQNLDRQLGEAGEPSAKRRRSDDPAGEAVDSE